MTCFYRLQVIYYENGYYLQQLREREFRTNTLTVQNSELFSPMVLVIQQYPEEFFTKCQHLCFLTRSKIPLEARISCVIWFSSGGEQQLSRGEKGNVCLRVETTRISIFWSVELRRKKRYNLILKVMCILVQMKSSPKFI